MDIDFKTSKRQKARSDSILIPEHLRLRLGLEDGDLVRLSAKNILSKYARVEKPSRLDVDKSKQRTIFLPKNMEPSLADWLNKTNGILEIEKAGGVLIGADPEFLVMDVANHLIVPGEEYGTVRDPIGQDTGSSLTEVRPIPAHSGIELVQNILDLFERDKHYEDNSHEWIVGSNFGTRYRMGGHIHLGGRPKFNQSLEKTDSPQQTKELLPLVYNELTKCLNAFIGYLLIRLDRPDPKFRRQRFGFPTDIRFQDEIHKLEWRVPSSIWLIHPNIAAAILDASIILTSYIYENIIPDVINRKEINTIYNKMVGIDYDYIVNSLLINRSSKKVIMKLLAKLEKILGENPSINIFEIINNTANIQKFTNMNLDLKTYWKSEKQFPVPVGDLRWLTQQRKAS